MKLYVHLDADQAFTKVVKIDDNKTVSDLREACWEILTARLPELAGRGPGSLRLAGTNRRPLSLTSRLVDVLASGEDVFYQVSTPSAIKPHAPSNAVQDTSCISASQHAAATAASSSSDGIVPSASASPLSPAREDASRQAVAARATPLPATPQPRVHPHHSLGSPIGIPQSGLGSKHIRHHDSEALAPVVRALWLRAEEFEAQQLYRGAGDILQQALLVVPEPSSPIHIATLVRIARLWLSGGNPGAAMQWALRAAKQRPEDPEVLELAGDCLREGRRPEEAALQYQSALEALQDGTEGATATTARDASSSVLRLRLSLAACLAVVPGKMMPPYDNQDLAASLVMEVLERNSGHWEAQRLYARIALDRGLREDALKVALRLLVGRPKHREAKALLAECLKDAASCRTMYEELRITFPDKCQETAAASTAAHGTGGSSSSNGTSSGNNSSNAAALAFVATAIKDFGKVDACIELLQRAVQLDPANPSYCLNLVHALELRQDLHAALEAGRSYCRSCRTQLAGRAMKDVYELLSKVPELHSPLQLTWYTSEPLWVPEVQLQSHLRNQNPSAEEARGDDSGKGGSAADGDGGAVALRPAEGRQQKDDSVSGAGEGRGGGGDSAAATADIAPVKVVYSADQLDELALLFTLAKVLFVGGALSAAAQLCQLVDPLRSASAVELHTTLIRNEAAYFGCVVQLLKDYPPPAAQPVIPHLPAAAPTDTTSPGSSSPSSLYLCGDSHCLSAAWRLVTLRGEQRLLRPLLVTGCKVWHLRPTSEFYPKKQFEASMRLLPNGAQVILVLGEIDCREGLLLAVQKGKYNTIAEGIGAVISIYMEILQRMVLERSMEVFVHPVPPVLNETRAVVVPFVAAMRAAVATARETDPTLRKRLHYLDFFNQLLVLRSQRQGTLDATGTGATRATTTITTTTTTPIIITSNTYTTTEMGAVPPAGPEIITAGTESTSVPGEVALGNAASSGLLAVGRELQSKAPSDACHGGDNGRRHNAELEGGGEVVEAAATPSTINTAASWSLRPDLAFDGTHLAPSYVPLLDAALSKVH